MPVVTAVVSNADGLGSVPITNGTAKPKTEVKQLPVEYYADFLSDAAKARRPGPIRGLLPLEKTPGLISLLAGKPNSAMFPFTSLQFGARDPHSLKEYTLSLDQNVLDEGLQYAGTAGVPALIDWLTDLQEIEHHRNRSEGWRVSVTSGSQDAIYKAVQAIINSGDSLLVEKPVYAGVIPMFESLRSEMTEVETDDHGIQSSSLRQILENWPASKPKPKALYTVPYGCNPTGMTATLERRLEVLELARQHNFIILEDDPYYYLYYGDKPRVPSYFTLEAQTGTVGHVLRFDSFSKILSSGIRVGFATGPIPLLNAMDLHTASANLQAASFSQAIVVTLLKSWGYEGLKKHTENVSAFYRAKRDVFQAAFEKHLTGLAEVTPPEAGMFYWFKILLPEGDSGDSVELIREKAFQGGVLALPGTVFFPSGAKTPYVRASFSLLDEADVDEALRRLRVVILEARGGR
ncbi:pyridoxal phosphate-dependent transferase [Vararia minispora EC-137]|uniref:Pyridoxal phosphate-dependent transferase n=1 Tax=Vararia minispora EC-137 TaxID=1314806 RepID=A0ACB8QSU5_9AGAM|nr:pyridoxal phosphate-dependent transferase [Vararia minispora EC-137]